MNGTYDELFPSFPGKSAGGGSNGSVIDPDNFENNLDAAQAVSAEAVHLTTQAWGSKSKSKSKNRSKNRSKSKSSMSSNRRPGDGGGGGGGGGTFIPSDYSSSDQENLVRMISDAVAHYGNLNSHARKDIKTKFGLSDKQLGEAVAWVISEPSGQSHGGGAADASAAAADADADAEAEVKAAADADAEADADADAEADADADAGADADADAGASAKCEC